MTTPHRLAVALLCLFALAALWGWGQSVSLTEEEEPFVGRWRQEVPSYKENGQSLAVDVELRKGTARFRVPGGKTGAAARELPGRSWRVVDGRFQFYTAKGEGNVVDSNYEVTWETPDRVRLHNPLMKTPTIILRRR